MGKFDSVLDEVYNKQDTKLSSVLDEIYGPKVEPITMIENEPTPIADMLSGLGRDIERVSKEPFIRPSIKSDLDIYYPPGLEPLSGQEQIEPSIEPAPKLFTAPPNQDVVVPEELDMGSMQAVRDRQAMIPPKAPVEPGYVPPAGITEGLKAALPIAYQGTKKGIAGAIQAAAKNLPITSFPTEPVAQYAKGVGEEAQKQLEQIIQEKQIRPGTVGGVTTDVVASMAQFLPIAGMSIIAPSVAPAGLAFLATVSGGDKYQKAKEAGFGEGEALAQGIAYGAAEAIGEKIGLDYLLAAAKNPAVMSGVKTIFAQGLKQAGVEGAEEGLTQIIQNATDIVAKKARPETKGEAPGILQDVPYSMGVGAISGGITGGGLTALQSMLGPQQAPQTEAPREEAKPEEPIRETPTSTEPAPQNMEQTTEFLTRKPTVTIGEAERLQGEAIPEGRGGMTIGPRRPAVTFGGEGERKIIGQSEKSQTISARPITEVGLKEDAELPPNVWLHGSELEGTISDFSSGKTNRGIYLTKKWNTARNYADNVPERIKAIELEPGEGIIDLNNIKQADYLANLIKELTGEYEDLTGKELQKMDFHESGLSDNIDIANALYDHGFVDAILDTNGNADIINDNVLKTYNPKGMTVQPTAPTNKLDQLFKRESTTPQPKKEYGYLMNARPFSIGAQPKGQVRVNERTDGRYGTIYYDRPLTEQEMKSYELKPEGPIVYEDVTDNPFYNDIKDLKVIDTDKSADNILELTGSDKPIFLRNGKERIAVITPSAKQKGKFQATKFDERGPIGDAVSSTPKEAIKSLIEDGYKELSNEQEFTELTFDTKETQRQEVIRNINKPSTPSPERQQAPEVAVEDIKPQPVEQTPVKTQGNETVVEISREAPSIIKTGKVKREEKLSIKERIKTQEEKLKSLEDKQEANYKIAKQEKRVPKSFEYGDAPTEKKYSIRKGGTNKNAYFEEVENATKFKPDDVPGDFFIAQSENPDYGSKLIHAKFPKNKRIFTISDGETGMAITKAPTIKEATENFYNIYRSKKLREAIDTYVRQHGRTPRYKKTTKSGPGMFGGATMQNAYEKIEPTLKKGADLLFKKGKQAYEAATRNADVTRDMGRVVDITEKEGKPVETEAPLRPRIGMFGAGTLQDIYEKIVGKKQTSNEKITIGDPNIAKKIDDAYDATDKIEMDSQKEAANLRQTVGGAVRQSMVDLFAPYLDLVKKDPARYEQALKKLHDVFYIPSEVEGFLNDYRDQILAPIKKAGKTYRDYSAYRMAKWTLTGRAKVKSKLTLSEAQQFIDSIDPQTRKLFEDITTNFHEKTWKPMLKLLEDSGLKDDKVINFIMDKENYSPFFPAKQMGLSYGSREYKPSGEIFKLTEKGYEGDIQDVLTSLMQKGISMLTHANINMAKLEGIDILKTMAPKIITKAKQSFKGIKKLKDSNGNKIEVPIMEFDEPAAGSQMALMTVREDGEAKGYYVPQQFAEAFDNALGDPASFADALRYFSQLTQSIKNVWIDYNPPWQIFVNAMRDIPAAAIEMPGFKKPVKFLGKVIKKAPAAVGDYIPFFGDVLQQITGYDRNQFDKQVTQMLKDKKLLSSKDVQHLGDYEITVFDRIQNAFDSFPKDGESQSFLQGMKAFGKDIERLTKTAFDETLQESGEYTPDEIVNMTRRGGSSAFAVRGGGVLNSAIKIPMMFYNAMKEGWRAGKYFYQKDPVGFTIKASVPLGIFAFGAAAAAGAFGDEWKKAYLAIKKSDRENKLTFPLWWKENGNIKYMALSVPQFLKPFMIMINEFASSNPSLADGFADALSNEMPSLNPILDIGKSLLAYGSNKPPVDRFGNPIMTQDQWTAGGSEKAIAMLKSISNQNLFGSYFKFPIKPSDKRKDWLETFYDASFGKIMKESYAPSIDTEEEDVNAAKARLLARQAIEAEESDPAEAERLREEMRKLGYTPSRQFMRSVRREMNIEREKKAGTITEKEAYEKRLRQQPKAKRKKYNELFRK